jgi:DNA-binding Lrp family transcriptional regulator
MPDRPLYLRPHDVAVVLQLLLSPEVSFAELARRTGVSVGEAHNAVKRLEKTPLLSRKGRRPSSARLLDFLLHGVPNVFPGELGPEARGVPTSHSGPDLREELVFEREIVWPSVNGSRRGQTLVPLVADAPELAEANPELYRLLALVDALRVGRARERELASSMLRERLEEKTS